MKIAHCCQWCRYWEVIKHRTILIQFLTIFFVRYANCSDSTNEEGAVGYGPLPPSNQDQEYENIYETINNDPSGSNDNENIYERVEDLNGIGPRRINSDRNIARPIDYPQELYNMPSCSTYGRIGNAYGRIDIIGHGIGRIERHLSSSCGSALDNHYAVENFCRTIDGTGRISKVSVQWLLVNKWLPLWIANTGNGRDYRIIDFLLGHRADYDNLGNPHPSPDNNDEDPTSDNQNL